MAVRRRRSVPSSATKAETTPAVKKEPAKPKPKPKILAPPPIRNGEGKTFLTLTQPWYWPELDGVKVGLDAGAFDMLWRFVELSRVRVDERRTGFTIVSPEAIDLVHRTSTAFRAAYRESNPDVVEHLEKAGVIYTVDEEREVLREIRAKLEPETHRRSRKRAPEPPKEPAPAPPRRRRRRA